MSGFFNNGVVGRDVEDARAVASDDVFDVVFDEHLRCGYFVKCHFLVDNLAVGVVEGAYYVDAFLDLLDDFVHHVRCAVACDGDFVDSGYGACAGGDAFDVEAPAGEYDGELIEQITREELEEKCQDYFQLEVEDVKRSLALIQESFPQIQAEVEDARAIRIYGLEDGAGLNQMLIENQISVYASGFHRMDLEEYFLERMEGGRQYV